MRQTTIRWAPVCAALVVATLTAPRTGWGQASPFRGLWVGSVSLDAVNEVSVPLNEANVPIAPNPEVPTPTHDRAELRLLIHVNGAGQACLLKDVAVLNRASVSNISVAEAAVAGSADLALVTDPRMYAQFPPQPAVRLASAAFDFGDAKATEALDAIVEQAAQQAAAIVVIPTNDVSTQAKKVTVRNAAAATMLPGLKTIAQNANVAASFSAFLTQFNAAALNTIASNPAAPIVSTLQTQAQQLHDQSFYGDTRGLDMLSNVVAAVLAASPTGRVAAAHKTASSFADVENLHQRFISGRSFMDMILAASTQAATSAKSPGSTQASIELAIRGIPKSVAALTEALQAKVAIYDDTRSTDAVNAVLAAMAESAFLNKASSLDEIRSLAEAAGQSALADQVARYPLPVLTPTLDYNAFVTSASFTGAAAQAATAAAAAAVDERAGTTLYTQNSLYSAAKVAAVKALQSAYSLAARAMRTELPLDGEFGPGNGDPRRVRDLAQPSDLGAPALSGRIYLPANHPTNPFRHRRHPDHTTGFDIQRVIRLDFDGVQGDSLEPAGYGVDRIKGTYREEIFGLHKPLGPDPVNQPIGLRTEGRFELHRISLIDTLNIR